MHHESSHQLWHTFPMFSRPDEMTPSLPIPTPLAPTQPAYVLPTPEDGMNTIQKWLDGLESPNLNRAAEKIKRPPNVFLIYRAAFVSLNPTSPTNGKSAVQRDLSQFIAPIWRSLPDDQRKPWLALAEYAVQEHKKRYPEYRYQPSRMMNRRKKASGKSARGVQSAASSSAHAAGPSTLRLSSIPSTEQPRGYGLPQSLPPYPDPNVLLQPHTPSAFWPTASSHPGSSPAILGDGMVLDRSSTESSLSWDPIFSGYEDASPMAPFLEFDMASCKDWHKLDNRMLMPHCDEGGPTIGWSEPFLYGGMASGSMDEGRESRL